VLDIQIKQKLRWQSKYYSEANITNSLSIVQVTDKRSVPI